MSDPAYPPLSPEAQAQMAEWQAQQALYNWQEADTRCLANLAALEPLETLGNPDAMIGVLATAAQALPVDEMDRRERINRIINILRTDFKSLLAELPGLKMQQPKPGTTAFPAPVGEE